jgi:hypothetical protein
VNAPPIRLGEWHQAYLYGMGTILILSGALWLLFHYYVRIPGDFGPTLHPLEPWLLSVHGISAAGILIGFGSVLPGHVRRAWRAARNRITGSIFFGVMLALIVTGYLLYYVGNETARSFLSIFHWVVGLGLPLLAGWHIWRGRVWRHIKMAEHRAQASVLRAHSTAHTAPDEQGAAHTGQEKQSAAHTGQEKNGAADAMRGKDSRHMRVVSKTSDT